MTVDELTTLVKFTQALIDEPIYPGGKKPRFPPNHEAANPHCYLAERLLVVSRMSTSARNPKCVWQLSLCLVALFAMSISATAQDNSPMKPIGLVIHGGAGTISRTEMTPEREREYRAGLDAALSAGYTVLERLRTTSSGTFSAFAIVCVVLFELITTLS